VLLRPCLDVLAQPKPNPPIAAVDDRLRKVVVPPKICRDRVVMSEAEYHGDVARRDEVLGIHSRRHRMSLRKYAVEE
jgi:hypothetical protein